MVNKKLPLVMSDLFEYDISSCYYNLMNNIGYNLDNIISDNSQKIQRNINIGLLQKNNKNLSSYLIKTTNSLINHYLNINNIAENELVIRQRDGIITTKKMTNLTDTLPIDFRGLISKLIISLDRSKWLIIYSSGNVSVKGISNKPINISFYDKFKYFDYSNRYNLMNGIEIFRKKFTSEINNIEWYCFKGDENNIIIPIENGNITINKNMIHMINQEDIDKSYIWNNYVWPFVQSILIHSTKYR